MKVPHAEPPLHRDDDDDEAPPLPSSHFQINETDGSGLRVQRRAARHVAVSCVFWKQT